MALLVVFGLSLSVALTGAMMPGPVLMVSVTRVAARGFMAAPRMVLGHGILEAGLVCGLFWGLSTTLQRPAVSGVVGLVGGVFLFWMGAEIIRGVRGGKVSLDLHAASPVAAGGAGRDVALGALTSVSNPYWLMWWATIGAAAAMEAMRLYGLPGLASFTLGHVSGDLIWYSLVGALVARGRHSLNERLYHTLLILCSLLLIALSFRFIVPGLKWLAAV